MAQTILVFVLVLVMPDGTTHDLIDYPETCPANEQVHATYDPLMQSGAILDWTAVCLHARLKGVNKESY